LPRVKCEGLHVDVKTGEIAEVEEEIDLPDELAPPPTTNGIDLKKLLDVLMKKGIIEKPEEVT